TANSASHALAEAVRWLTGQMPQVRAISEGISVSGRPSQNFSKPRNCVTWNIASTTSPPSFNFSVILAWPSMRVTGSITISRGIAFTSLPAEAGYRPNVGRPPGQQLADDVMNGVGGR